MTRTMVPLLALTLGVIGSTFVVSAHAQSDIPKKVTDKPGVIYGFGKSPVDGKPHRITTEGLDSICEIVRVKIPPPPEIVSPGWAGYYLTIVTGIGEPEPETGKGVVVVGGDRTTFKDGNITRDIDLRLEVKPKAAPEETATVTLRITDASRLAQHMAECIRLAKAWSTSEGKAASYPRNAKVGGFTDILGDTLTLSVEQVKQDAPVKVNFRITKKEIGLRRASVFVSTDRLGDVDILRRQVRRVQAWLENRPYIP